MVAFVAIPVTLAWNLARGVATKAAIKAAKSKYGKNVIYLKNRSSDLPEI